MRTVRERMQLRKQKDQPVSAVTIHMPTDVVEDLTEMAELLGYTRVEALIRAYVGSGMRDDLQRLLENPAETRVETTSR